MKSKTNAMRRLDAAGISYRVLEYPVDENNLAGTHIADEVGLPCSQVYKTLVAKGDKTGPVVFCIAADREIDLKKAARVTENKRVEMVHVKDLLGLTGYIRGDCSPVGMKKKFPTYVDRAVLSEDEITISAGVRGAQLLLSVEKLLPFIEAKCEDLTE